MTPIDNRSVAEWAGHSESEKDGWWNHASCTVPVPGCPDMQSDTEAMRLLGKLAADHLWPLVKANGVDAEGNVLWLCKIGAAVMSAQWPTPNEAIYNAVQAYLEWLEREKEGE